MSQVDPDIRAWADYIWDLFRPEEMYEALEVFRAEVRRSGDVKEAEGLVEGCGEEVDDHIQLEIFDDREGRER